MPGLTRTVAPATTPILIGDVRSYLKIPADVTRDNDLLTNLITEAVGRCEHVSGRALITQTWRMTLDSFWGAGCDYRWEGEQTGNVRAVYFDPRAGWVIQLPCAPTQSVGIDYVDGSGTLTTLGPTLYAMDTDSEPARITPAYGKFWPYARRQANAVKITFVAGYGADGSAVPDEIKQALLTCVGYRNEHRGEVDEDYLERLFARFRYGG